MKSQKLITIESIDNFVQGDIVPVKNSPDYVFDKYTYYQKFTGEPNCLRFYYSPNKKDILQIDAIRRDIEIEENQLIIPINTFEQNLRSKKYNATMTKHLINAKLLEK